MAPRRVCVHKSVIVVEKKWLKLGVHNNWVQTDCCYTFIAIMLIQKLNYDLNVQLWVFLTYYIQKVLNDRFWESGKFFTEGDQYRCNISHDFFLHFLKLSDLLRQSYLWYIGIWI